MIKLRVFSDWLFASSHGERGIGGLRGRGGWATVGWGATARWGGGVNSGGGGQQWGCLQPLRTIFTPQL